LDDFGGEGLDNLTLDASCVYWLSEGDGAVRRAPR
jgi:hypothetical protein